jgi:quercetin dioxygenase-like cupin family protein
MNLEAFADYKQVFKVWGREIWLVNSPLYCAKLLVLEPRMRCSLHRHLVKDETFFMLEGAGVYVESMGTIHGMLPGDNFPVHPKAWHRFWSPDGPAVLLEVSTQHSDADVERLEESGPCNDTSPTARAAAIAASPGIKES